MLQNSLLVMLALMQEDDPSNRTASMRKPFSSGFLYHGRYILVGALIIAVLLSALFVYRQRVGPRAWYQSIMSMKSHRHRTKTLDYIYRPIQGDVRDDDYENTFVGVSVPLLQDVSKV